MGDAVPSGGDLYGEEEWAEFLACAYQAALGSGMSMVEAQDVAQITMINLLVAVRTNRAPDNPKAWIWSVAARRSVDIYRSSYRRRVRLSKGDEFIDLRNEQDPGYDEEVVRRVTAETYVRQVLDYAQHNLSDKQFLALVELYRMQGAGKISLERLDEVVRDTAGRNRRYNANTEKTHRRRAIHKLVKRFPPDENQGGGY